jgi:hypothetical protein
MIPLYDPEDGKVRQCCGKIKEKFGRSEKLVAFMIMFICFLTASAIFAIIVLVKTNQLSKYDFKTFSVANYTIKETTCDIEKLVVPCYAGYLNLAWSDKIFNNTCLHYVTKSVVGGQPFRDFLQKTYPPKTPMSTYYKDGECYYNLYLPTQVSGFSVLFYVFVSLAMAVLLAVFYLCWKA